MTLPTKPKAGELVRVDSKRDGCPITYVGLITQDGRQTAKVYWLYPKWDLAESWVHYNRLERI